MYAEEACFCELTGREDEQGMVTVFPQFSAVLRRRCLSLDLCHAYGQAKRDFFVMHERVCGAWAHIKGSAVAILIRRAYRSLGNWYKKAGVISGVYGRVQAAAGGY